MKHCTDVDKDWHAKGKMARVWKRLIAVGIRYGTYMNIRLSNRLVGKAKFTITICQD